MSGIAQTDALPSAQAKNNQQLIADKVARNLLFGLVMLVATGVFVYGASTGVSQSFYVDEWFYDRYALELAQWLALRQPVTFEYIHPSGYSLTLAIVYGLYYLWGNLTGQFATLTDFLVHFATQRADFIVLGRWLSAGYAVATLFPLHWLATRMFDRRVGLIVILTFIFCYPVVFYAHLAANITMLMFLTAMASCWIYRVWQRGKPMDYALAGAFIGVGIGTKYYPALLFIPFGLAHLMRLGWNWRQPFNLFRESHKVVLAGFAAIILAVIFFPLPVFANDQWRYFLQDTLNYYTGGNPLENVWRLVAGNPTYWAATTAEPVSWWANSLLVVGQVGLLWLAFGMVYSLWKFPRQWLLLATPFITLFTYQSLRGGLGLGVRQLYFALPLLWILAAAAIVNLIDLFPVSHSVRRWLVVVSVGLLLVQPILWTGQYLYLVSHPTTVDRGRDWMLANLPRDAIILVDSMAAPFGETQDWREWQAHGGSVTGSTEDAVRQARAKIALFRVIELKKQNAQVELDDALKTGQPVFVVMTDYFSTGYWDSGTLVAWGGLNQGRAAAMRQYYAQVMQQSEIIWQATPRQYSALGPIVTIARVIPERAKQ